MHTPVSNTGSNVALNVGSNIGSNVGSNIESNVVPNISSNGETLTFKTELSDYDQYLFRIGNSPELTINYDGNPYECFFIGNFTEDWLVCFNYDSVIKMKKNKIKPKEIIYYNHFIQSTYSNDPYLITIYIYIPKNIIYENKDKRIIVQGNSIFEEGEIEDKQRSHIHYIKYSMIGKRIFLSRKEMSKNISSDMYSLVHKEINRMNEDDKKDLETTITQTIDTMTPSEKEEFKKKINNEENKKSLYSKLYSAIRKPNNSELENKMKDMIRYNWYINKKKGALFYAILDSELIGQIYYKYESHGTTTHSWSDSEQTESYIQYKTPSIDLWNRYQKYEENKRLAGDDKLKLFFLRFTPNIVRNYIKNETTISLLSVPGSSINGGSKKKEQAITLPQESPHN
jgi:hypothetical protein